MHLPKPAPLFRAIRSLFKRPTVISPPVEILPPSVVVSPVDRLALEEMLDTPIQNLYLFEMALRHRSVLRNDPSRILESNERLEFLGDAVLGMIIGEYLYQRFSDKDEGFLTRTRAKLVNGEVLAIYARRIGLNHAILISRNMEDGGGRTNTTILADAFEAVIGALYLDQGYAAAQRFVLRVIVEHASFDELVQQQQNFKSQLLEYVQSKGWAQPDYRLVSEEGPSHQRVFTVCVYIQDKPLGQGTGASKKQAEQRAAAQAMEYYNSVLEH
ncbi:MAG: ribonuclease III [Bacteroidetes Order II. Incertae sedis bacterium]|nr:ribonuclease III [Bacteroidetes Order II. bacterium]